jgi:hypothetical protein
MLSSRFKIATDVFVGFLALFYVTDGVGRSLAPEVLYSFLCAFISFMLARSVIFCVITFITPSCVLLFTDFELGHPWLFIKHFVE